MSQIETEAKLLALLEGLEFQDAHGALRDISAEEFRAVGARIARAAKKAVLFDALLEGLDATEMPDEILKDGERIKIFGEALGAAAVVGAPALMAHLASQMTSDKKCDGCDKVEECHGPSAEETMQ